MGVNKAGFKKLFVCHHPTELRKNPKATDYIKVKFYYSNTCLNFIEHIYYFPQQKIKTTDAGFAVLFSL